MSAPLVRHARPEDFEKILAFIRDIWGDPDYSFITNPEIFRYVHLFSGELRYIVTEDSKSGALLGMLGYIRYGEAQDAPVSAAFLKVKPGVQGMVGVQMLALMRTLSTGICLCTGILENTLPIYEFLEWPTGKLSHYYRLGTCESFALCTVRERSVLPVTPGGAVLRELSDFSAFVSQVDRTRHPLYSPFKSDDYIRWRYFDFPFYKYRVFAIDTDVNSPQSVLFTRTISHKGARMLAIVDFLGEESDLAQCSFALAELLLTGGYEYLEFFAYGLSPHTLAAAGLTLRTPEDPNILPSHFEPFLRENVEKFFFSTDLAVRLFRGDANQDIPRHWPTPR